MLMSPEAEDAWIKGGASRAAHGWRSVAFYFSDAVGAKRPRAQVTRVVDGIAVPWKGAADYDESIEWILGTRRAVRFLAQCNCRGACNPL